MRWNDIVNKYHFIGLMFTSIGIFGILDSLFIGLTVVRYTEVLFLSLILMLLGWMLDMGLMLLSD